jgi:hypothetical protein
MSNREALQIATVAHLVRCVGNRHSRELHTLVGELNARKAVATRPFHLKN